MSLSDVIARQEPTDYSLVVVNPSGPRQLTAMLEGLFEGQSVSVEERDLPAGEADADQVLLLDGAEEVLATSTMTELADAVLTVNSDLFVTGTRGLPDLDAPEVITALTDTPFTLQGYPRHHKEKLLLILVSRVVERRAWAAGTGTLRSAFQRLSRIDDELGTRRVYERLAATDVDLHVYGVPDDPPSDLEATVHGEHTEQYRRSWFVVFRPAPPEQGSDGAATREAESADPAAMVAIEREPEVWDGFWTERPSRVREIDRVVRSEFD